MPNILQIAKGTLKNVFRTSSPKGVQAFEVPIAAGFGGAAKAGTKIIPRAAQGIKGFFQRLPNLIKSKTLTPAAAQPVSKIPKVLGKAALGGAITGGLITVGSEVSKSGITGETPNIIDVIERTKRGAIVGAGIGVSPLGGLYGAVRGTEIVTGKKAKETIQELFGITRGQIKKIPTDISGFPEIPNPIVNPTNIFNFPGSSLSPSTPQVYLAAPSPAFAPSVSVSGGIGGTGENLPLMLLLLGLGVGTGGYLLGKRKKKKRKKYKKRRT